MSDCPDWAKVGARVLYRPSYSGPGFFGTIAAEPHCLAMFGDDDNGVWTARLEDVGAGYAEATGKPAGTTSVKAAALTSCEPVTPSLLLERLAGALLLFHGGGQWDDGAAKRWLSVVGQREATTRVLCDFARATQAELVNLRERGIR